MNKGWNGKLKDSSPTVESDVYVWTVDVADQSGEKHYYKGAVTLIR
jgi:hypothetical protein